MPHKANAARRHHIPRPKRKVTNWAEYDASLRQPGSLTVWFTEDAIAHWKAAPRTTPGGQPNYSNLAITTGLMLRAVFRLALRQTEGLVASVLQLLGLDLPVPDHSTLARCASTVTLPEAPRSTGRPLYLLVDSTGLKLRGPGEWLIEKHGTRKRRSWKKLHVGMETASGRIVAATLTDREVDDAAQVGPLLDQVTGPVAAFTSDGAYDRSAIPKRLWSRRLGRTPCSATPPRPRPRRDHHIQMIAGSGRMAWQRSSGYNQRAKVEGQIGRWKQVLGPALRFHTDQAQATEVAIGVAILNRMLDLGRPNSVRTA